MQECSVYVSDMSESEGETDDLVQDYLNDTEAVSELAQTKSQDTVFTPEQLEKIALYKTAIAYNRDTAAMYKKLEDSLIKMLEDVRKRLKENEAALLKQSSQLNEGFTSYLRCGKPYFKDKDNFPPPDNEDTIMMKQAQMYDFSQTCAMPGWTLKDKTDLVTALLEFSRDIKKKEYKSEISRLRKENVKENLMEITRLEREITQLSSKSLSDIVLPIDQDYDWEDIANSLNNRHTAGEYKAIWKLFFHPSINKDNWSVSEHDTLKQIATAHKFQDWEQIAKELNTGRTGYQCFVYYRTNLAEDSCNSKWSAEETEYMLRVIDYFREGTYIPWGKVASAMEGRTKIQCYNRYLRTLERRKGRFLEEEDVVLISAQKKYGNNFKKIAEFLPGRSVVQLKVRFALLNKQRLSNTWTVEEDKKLLQIMANQDSSYSFSKATAHFPGKDRTIIRSRYVTLSKWIKANPTLDLSMAPRRGARRLVHGRGTQELKDAINNLNKRIESELKIKKNSTLSILSSEEDIESGIMAKLINEIVKEEAEKNDHVNWGECGMIPDSINTQNTNDLCKLLIFLNASLNKNDFENSTYADKFPNLTNIVPEDSQVKLKCYSKVKAVETVQRNYPDLWNNKKDLHKSLSFILPPNYATITGCRVIMKHVSAMERRTEETKQLATMFHRNKYLKEAVDTLKERFITLFLWPVLLTNEEPSILLTEQKPYIPLQKVQKRILPAPSGPTVRIPKPSQMKRHWSTSSDSDDTCCIDERKRKKDDIKKTQAELPELSNFRVGVLSLDEDSLPD